MLNSSSTWDYKFHGETSAGGFDAVIFKANGANDYVGRDTITVVLNTAPSADVTVNIAGVSTEFTVEPTQLTFTTSNWNTPQTVYIHAIQDNTTDTNQTENLTITTSSSDSNYNGLSANSPVTITDQTPIAPSVGIGFDNSTVTEGNSGTQTRTLTAYLDQLHSSNVTINLAYGSGSSCSATSGSSNDFAYASSSMTISAGQSQATQSVTIYGDTTFEDNETVCIDISSVTNGVEEGTQRATLTILNDDAAGPAAPVLNSVTAGVQQNTIAWSAYTGATGYKLYWDTSASVSTSDNLITISDNSSTSYVHSGRTAGTQYYYRLIATTAGGDSVLSNELSDTPTAFVGCTSSGAVADNDPDLLVHYAFEGNLEDIEDTNSDNRYDLTNEEGTMQFAQGCAQGQAAYIDSASGFGVNDNSQVQMLVEI